MRWIELVNELWLRRSWLNFTPGLLGLCLTLGPAVHNTTLEKSTLEKSTLEKSTLEKSTLQCTEKKHCRKARYLLCTAFKSTAQTHLCVHLNSCAHSILQIILVPVVQFRAVVLCWDILLWRGLTETSQAAGAPTQQGEAAKSGVNVLTRCTF